MPTAESDVREWVINHQHNLVVKRYADIDEGHEIVDFFARYLYPSFADRRSYEERNEFIRRLVVIYKRGKLRKQLGAAVVLYAPLIWLADRMKELPDYLMRMVALYDRTEELDGRVVRYLCENAASASELSEDLYKRALTATATQEERRAQVNEVIDIGGYAVSLVERGGIVDLILRFVPHVPFFTNNPVVRGLNESLTMVQTGFRAFKNQGNRIQQLKELCRQRELEYTDDVYNRISQEENIIPDIK